MAIEKITVPDLGEASDVEVIELLVTVGQQVAENDSLLVLESDKAAMEIPAPMAGIVKSIAINLGDTVSTGVEILSLEVESNNASAEQVADVAADETQQAPPQVDEPSPEAAPASDKAEQPASIESVVTVPDLGTDDEVDVIEIHVSAGDRLEADQPLLTLESDKAAMEVPSPQAGEVLEILVKVGDKVKTGAEVLKLSASAGGDVAPAQEAPAASNEASGKAAAIRGRCRRQSLPSPLSLLRKIFQSLLSRLRSMPVRQFESWRESWVLIWRWCRVLALGPAWLKKISMPLSKSGSMAHQQDRLRSRLLCLMLISRNSGRLKSCLAPNCRKLLRSTCRGTGALCLMLRNLMKRM